MVCTPKIDIDLDNDDGHIGQNHDLTWLLLLSDEEMWLKPRFVEEQCRCEDGSSLVGCPVSRMFIGHRVNANSFAIFW